MTSANLGVGLSQCNWTSCLEGCTRELFKCYQIQVEVLDAEWETLIWERVLREREQEAERQQGLFGAKEV